MKELLVFVTTFGLFGGVALIAYLYWKVWEWNYNRKITKQKELYPELYKLRDEIYKINKQIGEYSVKSFRIKDKIDAIIEKMIYLVPDEKEKAETELTDLRFELKSNEEMIVPLEEKVKDLQEKCKQMEKELESKGVKIY